MLGAEEALSKSTVSRICQSIRDEFDAWKTRDLSGVWLDYLFLDGSHFRMHAGAPAEPVLAAWGIDVDGKPVFVGLAPAASKSTDAWDDFLAVADRQAVQFAAKWKTRYPAAVACVTDDLASLTCTCGSPPSTGGASATPTSSSAPSARPADA